MKLKNSVILVCMIITQLGFGQTHINESKLDAFLERIDSKVVMKKDKLSTPHRVICSPISLADGISNAAQLEALIASWLFEHKASFHIDTNKIKKRSIHKRGTIWYAEYYQVFKGKEVLDTELIFRVHQNGNLMMFGMDYHEIDEVDDLQLMKSQDLVDAVTSQYKDRGHSNADFQMGKEFLLPTWKEGKYQFIPVQELTVSNQNQLSEIALVNQKDGSIQKMINKCVHGNVTGKCSAQILPTIPTEAQVLESLPFLNITINGEVITSDESGQFTYPSNTPSVQLQAGLDGKYVTLKNFSGNEAFQQAEVQCDEAYSLTWDDSNSTLSERNVYYHINKMHEGNKAIDPDFTQLDYPLECIVNDNSAFCNAYWNGVNLHFNTQDQNCMMNSAHGASVIYHEYGHAVNDRLYNQIGHPWGLKNPILHEAFSDIYSTLLLDDSRFALGWFGPGTMTRNLNNLNVYPASVVGQQHTDGLILGGAFWDLSQLTSREVAYRLSHYAKYGAPDDEDLATAFAEVYLETLIADDDDGDLTNGSPNSQAIQTAFCGHGIGTDLLISQKLNHEEHNNTVNTAEDYEIRVEVPRLNLGEEFNHINLVYTTDNFENVDKVEMELEEAYQYAGYIPSMDNGTLVKYYFEVLSAACNSIYYHPSQDFQAEYYSFIVGEYEVVFDDDFESDLGWQLSTFTDNATAGRWQRSIPQEVVNGVGQLVSPANDHSENGSRCLITGATFGNIWYANDVDGGKTTVTSPMFSDLDEQSVFEFHKWFIHGSGFIFPAQGQWKIEMTNNGSNWVTVEQTSYGEHRHWIKGMYKFSDYVDINEQVQIRIEVSDFGPGSIVEGLFDDFKIYQLDNSTSTTEIKEDNDVVVYPNPATELLNINFNTANWDESSVTLFNLKGERLNLRWENLESNHIQVDISQLAKGVYYLHFSSVGQLYSQPVLIYE